MLETNIARIPVQVQGVAQIAVNFNILLILIADQMDRRESINASVNQDVEGIFNSKTYSQLVQLHKQINQKIASGDAVDIGKHHLHIVYIL